MAQADATRVDNGSGFGVREGLNDGVEAGLTNSAGTTPPPVTIPSLRWYNPALAAESIRTPENIAWERWDSRRMPDPPGIQNNEAAGYPPNAFWGTVAGQFFIHRGAGVWYEVGTGGGGGGTGGGGMFLNFLGAMRMIDDSVQPALGIDTSGRMRLVEDGT